VPLNAITLGVAECDETVADAENTLGSIKGLSGLVRFEPGTTSPLLGLSLSQSMARVAPAQLALSVLPTLHPLIAEVDDEVRSIHATLGVVTLNASMMAKLLDDFLSLEKIEEGKMDLEEELFNPAELAEQAISMFTAPLELKALTLELDVSAKAARTIVGDPNKLRQVLCNFLSNAIKFSPSGGRIVLRIQPAAAPRACTDKSERECGPTEDDNIEDTRGLGSRVFASASRAWQRLSHNFSSQVAPLPLSEGSEGNSAALVRARGASTPEVPGSDGVVADGPLPPDDSPEAHAVPERRYNFFMSTSHTTKSLAGSTSNAELATNSPRAEIEPSPGSPGRGSNSSGSSSPILIADAALETAGRTSTVAQFVRFAVHDNGVGIGKADVAKLFQPFQQIKAGAQQKGNGTGLGLSICKKIVELSGGSVNVHSKEGQGSVFSFTVPIAGTGRARLGLQSPDAQSPRMPQEPSAEGQHSPAVPVLTMVPGADVSSSQAAAPPGIDSSAVSVSAASQLAQECVQLVACMVVDDVQSNRELFARLLKRRGVLNVHMAENGAHALSVLDALSLDDAAQLQVVFLDKEMPVMDGHAAATAFRSRGILLPIIGLTGNALEEDRRLFINAGATAVLSKPVRVDAVEAALSTLRLRLAAARARPGMLPPPPLIDEPFTLLPAPADSFGGAEQPREAEVASIEDKGLPPTASRESHLCLAEPEQAAEAPARAPAQNAVADDAQQAQ
jgi:hypothetical protein